MTMKSLSDEIIQEYDDKISEAKLNSGLLQEHIKILIKAIATVLKAKEKHENKT